MREDVSSNELWTLYTQVKAVTQYFGYAAQVTNPLTQLSIRWDDVFLPATRVPADVLGIKIQKCLKSFETLTIQCRHIRGDILERFLEFSRLQGSSASLVELTNRDLDKPVRERTVFCSFVFDDFVFKYSNNASLPSMCVAIKGS